MPLVPENLKERLKREVSIQRLAEARGIKLTRKGTSLMGAVSLPQRPEPKLVHRSGEERVELPGGLRQRR